jgi:hypothetical protein
MSDTVLDKQCFDLTQEYSFRAVQGFVNESSENIIIRHKDPLEEYKDNIFCYSKSKIRSNQTLETIDNKTYYQVFDDVYISRAYYDVISNTSNSYRFFDIYFVETKSSKFGTNFNVYSVRSYSLDNLQRMDSEINRKNLQYSEQRRRREARELEIDTRVLRAQQRKRDQELGRELERELRELERDVAEDEELDELALS